MVELVEELKKANLDLDALKDAVATLESAQKKTDEALADLTARVKETEEKLKADFTATLQHLVNINSIENLNNTQKDFINRLINELHDRGFEQQYEQLSELYAKLEQEHLDDEIKF